MRWHPRGGGGGGGLVFFDLAGIKTQNRTNQYLVENDSEPNESQRMKDEA